MKIGVFDSGVGGLSVARAVEQAFPLAEVRFVTDPEHFPYGSKPAEEIWQGITPIFQKLADQNCDVIVVACNTVSTTLIDQLRQTFAVPMVAVEPMIKPAVQLSQTKKICVCATPTTLASQRYQQLKKTYASQVEVIEPDCSDWSKLIEENAMNEQKIRETISPAIEAGADVIVLACTHYHWIEEEIKTLAGNAVTVLQPEAAIITQLRRVLQADSQQLTA